MVVISFVLWFMYKINWLATILCMPLFILIAVVVYRIVKIQPTAFVKNKARQYDEREFDDNSINGA